MQIVRSARAFAIERHAGQRYGQRPYRVHLEAVAQVLVRFRAADAHLLAAAWLHDVLEDTATDQLELRRRFGPQVADIVWAVTCEGGANRAERFARTYPKIARTQGAATVKVADRIANCEAGGKLAMYRREHPGFRAALAPCGAPAPMWEHLKALLA